MYLFVNSDTDNCVYKQTVSCLGLGLRHS